MFTATLDDSVIPMFPKPSKHQIALWSYRLTLILEALNFLGSTDQCQIVFRDIHDAISQSKYGQLEMILIKWEGKLFDDRTTMQVIGSLAFIHKAFESLV